MWIPDQGAKPVGLAKRVPSESISIPRPMTSGIASTPHWYSDSIPESLPTPVR